MKMLVNYIDSEILLNKENIFSFEIENKHYFYRLVNDLNEISNHNTNDEIKFFNKNTFDEINVSSKLNVFTDYFNFDLNNKKIISCLYSLIEKEVSLSELDTIAKSYKKIEKLIKSKLQDFNFSVEIDNEFAFKELIKLFKINIIQSDNLIDNLITLIDIIKISSPSMIPVFINLKSYLSLQELEEFYKYAIYNEVQLIMVDSKAYGVNVKNEKKLVIDEDLFEFMI